MKRRAYLLGFLGEHLSGSPGDVVEVGQRVQDEQQVHGRDGEQVDEAGEDALELLRVQHGRYHHGQDSGDEEDEGGRAGTVLVQLQCRTHDHGHHDQSVGRRQDLSHQQLKQGDPVESDV